MLLTLFIFNNLSYRSLEKLAQQNGDLIFDFVCATQIVDHVLDDGQTTSIWYVITYNAKNNEVT